MAQNSKDTSQYLLTPLKDWYLDIMVARSVPASEFDEILTIPTKYDQRPDLLSQEKYGTVNLWWVFAVRNPDLIIDPIADFVAGLEIYVPINVLRQ